MRECQVSYILGIKKRSLKSTKQDWVQWRDRVSGAVRGTMQRNTCVSKRRRSFRKQEKGMQLRLQTDQRPDKFCVCRFIVIIIFFLQLLWTGTLDRFTCGGWTLCWDMFCHSFHYCVSSWSAKIIKGAIPLWRRLNHLNDENKSLCGLIPLWAGVCVWHQCSNQDL